MDLDLISFIMEEAFIIVPAIWVIGIFLKRTPLVPDWTVVWILLAFGILGGIGILGFTVMGIIQGIIVTGVAVLGYQLVTQTVDRDDDEDDFSKH